jgi:tetratricopeptide (TPR) repeat protein
MRPENADFVLCVCTPEYARRVEGQTAADVGKGVFWEGTLIYNELYDAKGNPRCLPVLLNGGSDADIPRILRNYTWFRLDDFSLDDSRSSYARLYRLLTRQASVSGAELGAIVPLPPLPAAERITNFGALVEDIRAGVIEIRQDTKAIRREQEAHGVLLERIYQQAARHPWSALHQLKPPPEHFTGRAEPLAELCAALREQAQSGNAVVISAVNGMGGVGKTALATMASHALLADFPDMQLFLELRAHSPQPASAGQARDSVLQAAHPDARLPDDDDARWRLYRQLFHGKRALVVLDDAADDEQVRSLSPPPGCALLVTSRRRLRTGCSLHLDRLPRAEAADLLRTHAPRLTEAEAERLAQLCGDLPVALKTAGGYLKAYPTPVAEYLAELEENRLEGLSNDDDPLDDVNRVFEASYRALSESERRAFAALSVMPADFDRDAGKAVIAAAIRRSWLYRLLRRATPDTNKLLDRLVHLNLLDYGESSGRYDWYDLLRDYAAARLPENEAEQAQLAHAKYFTKVARQADALYLQGNEHMLQGLALFDRERTHFEAAFSFLTEHPRWTEELIRLVDSMIHTGDLRFLSGQHIRWLEARAEAARRGQGITRRKSNNALGLGIAYRHLGELRKAIECHEQYLAIAHNIGSRLKEGIALGNLGNAYADLDEPRKAIEYYEQALTIGREIGDRHSEVITLGNLGLAYADLGEPHKAIEYYEQQLAIAHDIGDWRGVGGALGNMGSVYYSLDESRKAIEHYEQALVIGRKIGDRRGESNTLGNLGTAYYSLGEPRKAIEYYEQHLTIARDIGDRRGEGIALWNSALAYEALGERAEAISRAERALAIREAIEDPEAAKVRAALAEWRDENGDEKTAQ